MSKNTETSFQKLVQKAVEDALADDAIINTIKTNVENMVSSSVESMFKYGEAKQAIDKKLRDAMASAIDSYDFSKYVDTLDTVLTELIKSPCIESNNKVLNNFKIIMSTPDHPKTVSVTDLLKKYGEFVADNVSTDDREVVIKNGNPVYEPACCEVHITDNRSPYTSESKEDENLIAAFCTEDESEFGDEMNFEVQLHRWSWQKKDQYNLRVYINPTSIRSLSSFEAYLYSLMVNNIPVVCEETECMYNYSDEIEVTPTKEPQPKYQ